MTVICNHRFQSSSEALLGSDLSLPNDYERNHIEGLMMAWYSLLAEIDSCIKRVKDFIDELQTRNINKLKSYSIFCIDQTLSSIWYRTKILQILPKSWKP